MTELPSPTEIEAETRRFHIVMTVILVVAIAGPVALILWLKPTPEERFDGCMTLAERGGLLPARREDAALICLGATTRPRDTSPNTQIVPIVLP